VAAVGRAGAERRHSPGQRLLSQGPKRKIQFGLMKGDIDISDDFDAPLPDDLVLLLLLLPAGRDQA